MNRTPSRGGQAAARARASRRARPELVPLESRQLLSVVPAASSVEPSAEEQYMVQLVNRARANPQAEGQRLLNIARTDPTIIPALTGWDASAFLQVINSQGPLPPLAINPRLTAGARAQDGAMVAANAQIHSEPGSLAHPSNPSQLAPDGQPYYPTGDSSWATAENIFAYSSNLPDAHGKALADFFHEGFLLDWGNPDFGHLRNLMLPGPSGAAAAGSYAMSEIGVGIITDAYPTAAPTPNPLIGANLGLNVGPALVTQEFGYRSGHEFLTGAIFADRDGDGFYTPGEGLGGVTVRAVNRDTGAAISAVTWGSGGYSIDLPSGNYDVTASGGGLASPRATSIRIGIDNVGWDVNSGAPAVTTPTLPILTPTPTPTPTPAPTPAAPIKPTPVRKPMAITPIAKTTKPTKPTKTTKATTATTSKKVPPRKVHHPKPPRRHGHR